MKRMLATLAVLAALPGARIHLCGGLQGGGFDAVLLGRWPDESGPLFRFALTGAHGETPWELMDQFGHLPLPPYIERQQNAEVDPDAAEDTERLRRIFNLTNGNFDGAQRVSTLHDMRFVFFDDNTRILFATAYDGDWDAYINDFATKIPELMDLLFQNVEGWPGIDSPEVKDFIADLQIDAAGWFVANPQVTVVDVRRLQRMEKAVNEMMDEVAGTDLDNSGPKALKAFLDKMSQPEGVDY